MSEEETTELTTNLTPKQTDQFRARINTIVEAGKKASIDLCWAVYESDVNMTRVHGQLVYCWSAWGYASWEDFLGKEMDLHVTTANAYKKVWEVFYVDLEGAWDTSQLLGITKMKILSVAPLTKGNVNAWLKKARKLTCRELVALVYDREVLHSFAVPVTASQLRIMQRTLDQAKDTFSRGENMTRGQLMTQIMREWAELKGAAKPRLKSVA